MYHKLLIGILLLLSFSFTNCNDGKSRDFVKKNEAKTNQDFVLNRDLTKVTDSTFLIKNGLKELYTIHEYLAKDSIMKSTTVQSFKNDTLVAETKLICNKNGNVIETISTSFINNSKRHIFRTLDEHDYIIEARTEENGKTSFLNYKNEYKNGRQTKRTLLSKNGSTAVINNYKYDDNGNLVEENKKGGISNTQTVNKYNNENQILESLTYADGNLDNKTLYYYSDGLLIKKELYWDVKRPPFIFHYQYDKKNQLIKEEKSNTETIYENYDSSGNWSEKKVFERGALYSITLRSIKY